MTARRPLTWDALRAWALPLVVAALVALAGVVWRGLVGDVAALESRVQALETARSRDEGRREGWVRAKERSESRRGRVSGE